MQAITTYYKNNRMHAKCANGKTKIDFDAALSVDDNNLAAANALLDILNKARKDLPAFEIKHCAPDPYNGMIYLFGEVETIKPLRMSITVKFIPCTNTQPARMRVYSNWFKRGKTVQYNRWDNYDWETVSGCARYAADQMLAAINEHLAVNLVPTVYKLGQYIETYDGDRVFSLVE